MQFFPDKSRGAEISECGYYRYQLWRIWNTKLPKVLFIMLNPSKADAKEDDPTIKRCIGFTKSWGYGGFYVGNLFAYRSTSPKGLLSADDAFGKFNSYHLKEMAKKCDLVVCAWGNAPILKKMKYYPILDHITAPKHYLELAKDGTPKHPLYLKADVRPKLSSS